MSGDFRLLHSIVFHDTLARDSNNLRLQTEHSLSLVETGRILLVLELRFLMAMVSFCKRSLYIHKCLHYIYNTITTHKKVKWTKYPILAKINEWNKVDQWHTRTVFHRKSNWSKAKAMKRCRNCLQNLSVKLRTTACWRVQEVWDLSWFWEESQ